MSKFPLTTTGVQELMNELYALPQPLLQIEADAIGVDFRLWITAHFVLNLGQIQYLNNIDESWVNDAATESKYFLENRLPIVLYKEQRSSADGDDEDRGKLLDLDKDKKSSYSVETGYEKIETLSYTISYPIL